MTSRMLERSLWGLILVLLAVAGLGLRRVPGPESPFVRQMAVRAIRFAQPESVAAWARTAAAGDPFRFSHKPASLRFGVAPIPTEETERPPLPVFALLGTIGGPPWQGIVSGFPHRAGSIVVRAGDEIEGFVVKRIVRDTVVIQGRDTTFTLGVRRAWQ